jgi:hypothetical protein
LIDGDPLAANDRVSLLYWFQTAHAFGGTIGSFPTATANVFIFDHGEPTLNMRVDVLVAPRGDDRIVLASVQWMRLSKYIIRLVFGQTLAADAGLGLRESCGPAHALVWTSRRRSNAHALVHVELGHYDALQVWRIQVYVAPASHDTVLVARDCSPSKRVGKVCVYTPVVRRSGIIYIVQTRIGALESRDTSKQESCRKEQHGDGSLLLREQVFAFYVTPPPRATSLPDVGS